MTANDPDQADQLPGAPHPRATVELVGQARAEQGFLEALATGRMHHGWLLTGPRGVGKATLAWRIARHLLAGAPGGTLAMDPDHPVFRQVLALAAPRIWLCRRPWDDKAERLRTAITVDEVRALQGFFQLSAADGGWRVALVDAADELTLQAANALLKILEEPPARAMILLISHQPAKLLPTLRSRCRELRCQPLDAPMLQRALQAAGVPEGIDASALAALAGGSVGEAMRLVAADGPALYAEIVGLLGTAPGLDRRRGLALAESCAGRSAETRYDAALGLVRLALSRLALAGARGRVTAISDAEADVMARLSGNIAQARLWADLAPRLAARAGHARAVHLDPAQVILDMILQIDAAAAEARAYAA